MRLKKLYQKKILPKLKEEFSLKNNFLAPRLDKVVINVGFGRHNKDKVYIDSVGKSLTSITGQKPIFTKAKKSISAFKIREGMTIGAVVTLRGDQMYDFVEKLVNVSFPRVRDFRGVSTKSVDQLGNINIGFRDNLSFPEISPEMSENSHGLEISISTTAKNKEQGLKLFKLMGFPLKK